MNVLHKVTRESMKKSKVRTLITLIGVALSAALFTAVMTFCSSMANYLWKTYSYTEGTAHIDARWVEEDTCGKIREDPRVKEAAFLSVYGYSKIEEAKGAVPYLLLQSADADISGSKPIHLLEGRLAERAGEVIVPRALIVQEGDDYGIGSTLTLNLGLRMSTAEEGAVKWDTYSDFHRDTQEVDGESFVPNGKTVTVTVTGIYEPGTSGEDVEGMGFVLIGGGQEAGLEPYVYHALIKINNPGKNLEAFCRDAFGETYMENPQRFRINNDILMFDGYFEYVNIGEAIFCVAVLVTVMIMIGSVILIYSAFSISVSERTRQFGLLASIGTSKKQLGAMVRYEAAAIGAVGIPTGIAVGILGMGITLHFLNDKFYAFEKSVYQMELHIELWSVLLAGALAYLTIFISAWIPSKRTARVTAMEAIRQSRDICVRGSQLKVSRLSGRIFGMEGTLAGKYYKRDRKKYRVTVLSLAVSVLLVISSGGLNQYLRYELNMNDSRVHACDAYLRVEADYMTPDVMQEIRSLSAVDKAAYCISEYSSASPSEEMKADYDTIISHSGAPWHLIYMDDVSYEEMLKENGIGEEIYRLKESQSEAPAVAINIETVVTYETDQEDNTSRISEYMRFFTKAAVGTQIPGDKDGEKEQYLIGALIETYPFGVPGQNGAPQLIYPLSDYKRSGSIGYLYFNSENTGMAIKEIIEVMARNNKLCNEDDFIDFQGEERSKRDAFLVIQVFSWGFLIIISLIGAVNVFGTVTTNIILRRRDFAMLSSIGMTKKQRGRMLRCECLSFVRKALLCALPPSAFVLFILYHIFKGVSEIEFLIPWRIIAGAVLGSVLIVYLSLGYAVRKLRKEELTETLRREAI